MPRSVNRTFERELGSVELARRFVCSVVEGWPVHRIAEAQLVVSELVTNSVLHTTSPTVQVTLRMDPGRLQIEVADESTEAAEQSPFEAETVGGLGLRIVDQIVLHWGVEYRSTGKTVWCVLEPGSRSCGIDDRNSERNTGS